MALLRISWKCHLALLGFPPRRHIFVLGFPLRRHIFIYFSMMHKLAQSHSHDAQANNISPLEIVPTPRRKNSLLNKKELRLCYNIRSCRWPNMYAAPGAAHPFFDAIIYQSKRFSISQSLSSSTHSGVTRDWSQISLMHGMKWPRMRLRTSAAWP